MKQLLIFCVLLSTMACKDKPIDLSGDSPVKTEDFFKAIRPLTLPYNVSDTNLHKAADTLLIGAKVLAQFIPDSVLKTWKSTDKKITIRPVGKIVKEKNKEQEIYVLLDLGKNRLHSLYVVVFNTKLQYVTSKLLLENTARDGYVHSLSINREPTFLIGREKITSDNQLLYTRNGWAYNDAGLFMVVINDSNEDLKKRNEIINPIDTLPVKNKYSGEYIRDKKNFISIRDGKNADNYLFFIYFEKNGGNCIGELKGNLVLRDKTNAQYKESGDPCVIDFRFEGNRLVVKEQGSCGNHRGIKCFFDDSYTKKSQPKKRKR
jgi:hypothetical protein